MKLYNMEQKGAKRTTSLGIQGDRRETAGSPGGVFRHAMGAIDNWTSVDTSEIIAW